MFFNKRPSLGWILFCLVVLIIFINYLLKTLPIIDKIKSLVLKPIAKKIKFKKIVKAAIKYDIRGKINCEVLKLKEELPKNWINQIDLKWVEKESKEEFLNDNDIVIRVRPLEDQKINLANVLYLFLRKSFFPKLKKLCRKIIEKRLYCIWPIA